MKERFSKATVGKYVRERIGRLVKEHRFDLDNGTAQLKPGDVNRVVAYGEVRALEALAEQHDLGPERMR